MLTTVFFCILLATNIYLKSVIFYFSEVCAEISPYVVGNNTHEYMHTFNNILKSNTHLRKNRMTYYGDNIYWVKRMVKNNVAMLKLWNGAMDNLI